MRNKLNYKEIMNRMVCENKSIREMARELGIPNSTLHHNIIRNYDKIADEDIFLATSFDILMRENKETMSSKGLKKRWNKK